MAKTLILGARIIAAQDESVLDGDLLVDGNHIAAISRAPGSIAAGDALVVDGASRFLIPAMTEDRGHLSFDNITVTEGLTMPPPEDRRAAA
jgi:dihydroorotase-like cyclic amidohydrolase